MPAVLHTVLTVIFALDCVLLIIVVLMQQGKEAGLGSLAGGNMSDTFWSRNKGRSAEGNLMKFTRIFAVIFFVLAVLLNIPTA